MPIASSLNNTHTYETKTHYLSKILYHETIDLIRQSTDITYRKAQEFVVLQATNSDIE